MTFMQRFSKYLVGLVIGVMLSFMLFSNRSCTKWLPGNQVRKTLTANPIQGNALTNCLMDCYGLNDSIMREIASSGEINFKESLVRTKPLKYMVEGQHNGKSYKAMFEVGDTLSTVIALNQLNDNKSCNCN
jgi:hypothetical protein